MGDSGLCFDNVFMGILTHINQLITELVSNKDLKDNAYSCFDRSQHIICIRYNIQNITLHGIDNIHQTSAQSTQSFHKY